MRLQVLATAVALMAGTRHTLAEVVVILNGLIEQVRELDTKVDGLRTDPRVTRLEEKVAVMQWALGVCFTGVAGQVVYLVAQR